MERDIGNCCTCPEEGVEGIWFEVLEKLGAVKIGIQLKFFVCQTCLSAAFKSLQKEV